MSQMNIGNIKKYGFGIFPELLQKRQITVCNLRKAWKKAIHSAIHPVFPVSIMVLFVRVKARL